MTASTSLQRSFIGTNALERNTAMRLKLKRLLTIVLMGFAAHVDASTFEFTDETAYLSKLAELGFSAQREDFSNVNTTPYLDYQYANQGTTWSSWHGGEQIRIGSLANYDVLQLRANGNNDFSVLGPIYGLGVWLHTVSGSSFDTDTSSYVPAAHITFYDPSQIQTFNFGRTDADPHANGLLNTKDRFFGVINSAGFSSSVAILTGVGADGNFGGGSGETSEFSSSWYVVSAYNATYAVSPASVPLPPAYLMMAAGVGILGLARRRAAGSRACAERVIDPLH